VRLATDVTDLPDLPNHAQIGFCFVPLYLVIQHLEQTSLNKKESDSRPGVQASTSGDPVHILISRTVSESIYRCTCELETLLYWVQLFSLLMEPQPHLSSV
jgi:hypothetical protein